MDCLLCKNNVEKVNTYKRAHFIEMWKEYYDVSNIFNEENIPEFKCSNCNLTFFESKYCGDNAFYSTLGQLNWYYNHDGKTEFDYCQSHLKDGDKLLDIGCGIGILKSKLSSKIEYTGIELSSKAKQIAEQNGVNVINELIQEHALTYQEYYDVIVSFQVLEHLGEVDEFISSAIACLKPGGYFIIAVPNNETYMKGIPNNKFNLPPHHTIQWSEKPIKTLANIYNLEVIDISPEKIQKTHLPEARFSTLYSIFCRLAKKEVKTVDYSPWYFKTSNKIHKILKYIPNSILDLFFMRKYKNGHSIMATFKKK